MNSEPWLWGVLWLLVTVSLLALPFYPTWSEWRRPLDLQPNAVDTHTANTEMPLQSLNLASGKSFEKLHTTSLLLGHGPMPAPFPLTRLHRWQPPKDARPWGLQGWYMRHHLDIPADQLVPSSLVVRGRLNMQGPGLVEGDIKAHDSLRLGPGTRVRGNVFCDGDIWLGEGCEVSGLVMAKGLLHMSPGVVIGSPKLPTSVCADVVRVQGPAQVHGSVQARLSGRVIGD